MPAVPAVVCSLWALGRRPIPILLPELALQTSCTVDLDRMAQWLMYVPSRLVVSDLDLILWVRSIYSLPFIPSCGRVVWSVSSFDHRVDGVYVLADCVVLSSGGICI